MQSDAILTSYHIFFVGVRAHMLEFVRVRLQSLVRRLRTTDCKRTPSTSVVGALAPPEKITRRGLEKVTCDYFNCHA